jgi:predicted aspartyl protease
MSFVTASVRIANPHNGRRLEMTDVLIDTGATFTVLPFHSLERLGIKPRVKRRLKTARISLPALHDYRKNCSARL